MDAPQENTKKQPSSKPTFSRILINWGVVIFIILILAGVALGPICPPDCPKRAPQYEALQTSHTLALCLFQYAQDHDGKYPSGASSTEVFQKLLDENYASDPRLFYFSMPGKTPPSSSKLKPENVSWDLTTPINQNSPDDLPVVFMTGYRVEYKAGGRAIPLDDRSRPQFNGKAMPVSYHSNSAKLLMDGIEPNGTVLNFIPSTINLGDTHYSQLTPDGIFQTK